MDYQAYFKAQQEGRLVGEHRLPGADFNMQVTDWTPSQQIFQHEQYETTVDTIGRALVGLESLKDALMRIDLALTASEMNINHNNIDLIYQTDYIYHQLDVI